jgi:hypothetical protein
MKAVSMRKPLSVANSRRPIAADTPDGEEENAGHWEILTEV